MGFQAISKVAAVCLMSAGLVTVPAMAQSQPRRGHSATARAFAVPGYLGVGVEDLTEQRVKALHLKDDQGIEIAHVKPGSPASNAGLKEHDVILEVNGKPVESIEEFQNSIAGTPPGAKVNMTIWRNSAKQTVTATLEQRPPDFMPFDDPQVSDAPIPPMPTVPFSGGTPFPPMPANSPMVGFEGQSLTPQLAAYFGVKDGVLVDSVLPGTPAERAGLKAGDVVTKVNGTPVMSTHEITGVVRASGKKALTFTVVRNKKEIRLNVEIASRDSGAGSSDRVPL